MSYIHGICLEETALEGLDGITLACLWCRLDQRLPKFPLALDPKAKRFLWEGLLASQDVAIYCLPEPRCLLAFPHEYMTTDETTGIVFLKEEVHNKEYPACIINSAENGGIQGSCATFTERVDISGEVRGHDGGQVMTLEEAQERWGDALVVVASQELRLSTLLGPKGDPSVEFSDTRYCFLEYVGRRRHHGAQQVDFARLFNLSLSSLYNLGKDLNKHRLTDKRTCLCQTSGHLKNSIFLMLLRFGRLAKHGNMSNHGMISTTLIQILEQQPKRRAEFKFLSAELAKKLPYLGSLEYHRRSLRRTYLQLQKMNVLQVIHHSTSYCNEVESLKLLKKLSDDKEEATEEDSSSNYDASTSVVVAELPILTQVYNLIETMQHTPQGIVYSDFERFLNNDGRFLRRLVDGNLLRNKLVKFTMAEDGRQRTRKFHTINMVKESSPDKNVDGENQATASTSEAKVPLQTDRYMKRRQRVLELIRKHRVQEGCVGMLKEIRQGEAQEGRHTVCDRKSIFRIVDQLQKERLCEVFSTVVMSDNGADCRTVQIVLDMGVERTDAKVLHIIEQVRLRMISYKLHHPPPSHLRGKKNKLKKGKKSRPRASDLASRKRTAKHEISEQSESELRPTGPTSPAHNGRPGRTGKSDGDDDAKKSQSDNAWPAERQYVRKRNVYGLLPKMGKIKVLHRFVWYLVYGMPGQQAPQSAVNSLEGLGKETVTMKQEVGETPQSDFTGELGETWQASFTTGQLQDSRNLIGQSGLAFTSAGQSENLSEVHSSLLGQSEAVIGGYEQTAMPICQSESSVRLADQSEELFEANTRNQTQLESVIGGQKRTASAEGAGENRRGGSTSERSSTQVELSSASDLLASIESGTLTEVMTTPLPLDPAPSLECTPPSLESGTSNLESKNHNLRSTEPDFQSATPNPASTVPNLDNAVSNWELVLRNLESGASVDMVSPRRMFSVGQDARNFIPAEAKVYLDVMDWRRFVKPLPDYKDLPRGWCLLGDMVLSMPLVTFCEIIPHRYVIEGLEDYLKDPLLKLLLVKDLPDKLRHGLLGDRRYIYSMDSLIDQLCSLGLGVYAPHYNENKDVLGIYTCRSVSIVDTTSSQPGVSNVTDKTYPILKYHLRTLDDVEKYWFDLKVICLDTPLGLMRSEGQPAGNRAIKTKLTGFARKAGSYLEPVSDDGRIPGDGKGAGGFGSSLYCHLKRNWTTAVLKAGYLCKQRYHNRFSKAQRNTSERLSNPLKSRTVSLSTRIGGEEKVTVETKLVNVDEHKAERVGGKGLKRKRTSPPVNKKEPEASIARKKRREEKRRAKEERKQQKRQQRAVGIITRKVFSWTPREDSVLLLCKVATEVLNTNQSLKSFVTWETVQGVFAKKVPEAVNLEGKDAKVVATRSHRLMRSAEFRINYSVCLGDVKEDKAIIDSIRPLPDRSTNEAASEEFEKLFDKLEAKFRFADMFSTALPDDVASLRSNYTVEPIAPTDHAYLTFFKDEDATDVKRLTLHTIVLSTLSSQSASDYDARLVFKLYEQYDNKLLHDVFYFCRSSGIVNRCSKLRRRIMPCMPMSYQLSMVYARHFKSRMPHELPGEAISCQQKLLELAPDEDVVFPQVTCGACSSQIFLLSTDQVNCKIVIPKKVIIVDSNLIDQDFLKKSGLLKRSGDFSDSDSETDEDSEGDDNGEEPGGPNTGRETQIDGVGMDDSQTQGIGVTDRGRNVTGVKFDVEDDEETTGAAVTADDRQVSDEPSSRVVEEDANDRSVMDQLNALAEGLVSLESQFTNVIDGLMPSVIDMDHSYLASQPETAVDLDRSAVNGSGDSGATARRRPEERVTGHGCGSGEAGHKVRTADPGWSPTDPPRQTVEVLDGDGSVSPKRQEAASPGQAPVKSQPRNATMRCLSDSQSSFTKWLILQGHYAPGVCGKRISNLQDNIAFNAFVVRFSLDESSPGIPRRSLPAFQPCASLLEYLLRPCQRFVCLEPVRKPSELHREAAYLEELCKGKVTKRQGDSAQELTQRFTGIGLDATTSFTIIQIYERIEQAGFLGVTVPEVKRIVGRTEAAGTDKRPMEEYINILLEHEVIVEVGSYDLRLVATKHASLWMIHSHQLVIPAKSAEADPLAKRLRQNQPLGTHTEVPSRNELSGEKGGGTNIVGLTGEVPEVQGDSPMKTISNFWPGQRLSPPQGPCPETDVTLEGEPLAEGSEGRGRRDSPGDAAEEVVEFGEAAGATRESGDGGEATVTDRISSTDSNHGRAAKRKFANVIEGVYESVDFVPHPWCKVNGKVNRPELFQMIRGIALQVLSKPGIKELQIVQHLENIFRKVDTLKLLQIISDLGLITRHCVTLPNPSLFGRTKSGSQPTVYYYHPTINCLTIIGALFGKHQDTQE